MWLVCHWKDRAHLCVVRFSTVPGGSQFFLQSQLGLDDTIFLFGFCFYFTSVSLGCDFLEIIKSTNCNEDAGIKMPATHIAYSLPIWEYLSERKNFLHQYNFSSSRGECHHLVILLYVIICNGCTHMHIHTCVCVCMHTQYLGTSYWMITHRLWSLQQLPCSRGGYASVLS